RALVQSGASIGEINAVRRAISAVKGGGLATLAPHAIQLSLIISDTNSGEESNVASGPTFIHPPDTSSALDVVARYGLAARLPSSILRAVAQAQAVKPAPATNESLRKHYVLLTNEDAKAAAESAALARGFHVEVAGDIVEQEIASGCAQLLERLRSAHGRAASMGHVSCLLSGGEFACPVRTAHGRGGRNSETALRLALEIAAESAKSGRAAIPLAAHTVALLAGTDGIDGNSPAAGALSDETTLARAQSLGLNALQSLETSDAYTFFQKLGDSIMTGPTDTNVRDLRILLAG
ncbi:MAG TPA: MOFRL family protein, partial [Pyrinomonadaceae bacterium]